MRPLGNCESVGLLATLAVSGRLRFSEEFITHQHTVCVSMNQLRRYFVSIPTNQSLAAYPHTSGATSWLSLYFCQCVLLDISGQGSVHEFIKKRTICVSRSQLRRYFASQQTKGISRCLAAHVWRNLLVLFLLFRVTLIHTLFWRTRSVPSPACFCLTHACSVALLSSSII